MEEEGAVVGVEVVLKGAGHWSWLTWPGRGRGEAGPCERELVWAGPGAQAEPGRGAEAARLCC